MHSADLSKIFKFLDIAKAALVNRFKAERFKAYAGARRLLTTSYESVEPASHPCDLNRIDRDMRVEIDHQVGEYDFQVEQAFGEIKNLLESAADRMAAQVTRVAAAVPKVRGPKSAATLAMPTGAKEATRKDLRKTQELLKSGEGITLFALCQKLGCPATNLEGASRRRAIARYLKQLKAQGHVTLTGKGKGAVYVWVHNG